MRTADERRQRQESPRSRSRNSRTRRTISRNAIVERSTVALIGFTLFFWSCHGQIGPGPRYRQHDAVLESHQHPGTDVAPKDAADPTSVPT